MLVIDQISDMIVVAAVERATTHTLASESSWFAARTDMEIASPASTCGGVVAFDAVPAHIPPLNFSE